MPITFEWAPFRLGAKARDHPVGRHKSATRASELSGATWHVHIYQPYNIESGVMNSDSPCSLTKPEKNPSSRETHKSREPETGKRDPLDFRNTHSDKTLTPDRHSATLGNCILRMCCNTNTITKSQPPISGRRGENLSRGSSQSTVQNGLVLGCSYGKVFNCIVLESIKIYAVL